MTDPISAQVIDQRIVARLDLAANELDKIGTLSLPTLVRQAASEIQHAADHIDAQAATIKALVEALEHYSDVYCEGYCSISDSLDHDCGGCPARVVLAAAKEPT